MTGKNKKFHNLVGETSYYKITLRVIPEDDLNLSFLNKLNLLLDC